MNGELVLGEKQLLSGGRCPRCFQVQTHVRRVESVPLSGVAVILFSCLYCKRPIAIEVLASAGPGEVGQLRA